MRKETKDILFVAWLSVTKNLDFDSHDIIDTRRRLGIFYYADIDSSVWDEHKKEFYSSDTTKTRYAVQRLKDLLN